MILRRTSVDKNERPLLRVTDRHHQVQELLRFRRPFYERAADIEINTSRLDIDSVAQQIIERLKENEGFRR